MLSGPLSGSPFNRKLFARTQIWTLTLTSQVTKRRKNLSLRTILKNLVLLLWRIPHPRRPFLLLMPEFLCSSLFALMRLYLFIYIYAFFLLGVGPEAYVALLDKYSFFFDKYVALLDKYSFFFVCVLSAVLLLFSMTYMALIED